MKYICTYIFTHVVKKSDILFINSYTDRAALLQLPVHGGSDVNMFEGGGVQTIIQMRKCFDEAHAIPI